MKKKMIMMMKKMLMMKKRRIWEEAFQIDYKREKIKTKRTRKRKNFLV